MPLTSLATVNSKANGALLRRSRVGEDDELIEIVGVGLVELPRQRHEIELLGGRETLAGRSAAARDRPRRRRADVDRAEDAGFAGRHADHRARRGDRRAVDEVDAPVGGEAQLHVDAVCGAVEFRHVAPGEQQRIAVGPPEHAAAGLRGIEIVERRRDPRRAGEKPRHVPIRARVLLDHEGDVAVGVDERLAYRPA
jgi:hypothetical protein